MISFRINSSTKIDRHDMIDRVKEHISSTGGWITDFRMYSNISICLNLAVPVERVVQFLEGIKVLEGMVVSENSFGEIDQTMSKLVEYVSGTDEDAIGAIQITFVHHEKDLRIEIPQVPG